MRTGLFTPIQNKTTKTPVAPKKRERDTENQLPEHAVVHGRQQRLLRDFTNAEILGRQQDRQELLEALQHAPRKRPHARVLEGQARRLDFDDASADENAGDDHYVHRM